MVHFVSTVALALVAWVATHASVILLAVFAWHLDSIIIGKLPKRAQASPVAGVFVRVMAALSYIAHHDEPGSVTWPLVGRTAMDAIMGRMPAGYAAPTTPYGTRDAEAPIAPVKPADLKPPFALLLAVGLAAMLAPALHGCSGAQHPARTPAQDARLAINGAAHVVQLTDTGLAAAYRVDAADAGPARLDALERAYASALHAVDVARASLYAADAARATYEAAHDAPSGCALGRALGHAASDVVAAAAVANAVHAGAVPDTTRDTVGALATGAQAFVRQCPVAVTDGGAE